MGRSHLIERGRSAVGHKAADDTVLDVPGIALLRIAQGIDATRIGRQLRHRSRSVGAYQYELGNDVGIELRCVVSTFATNKEKEQQQQTPISGGSKFADALVPRRDCSRGLPFTI